MGKDFVVIVENSNSHIGSIVIAYPYVKDGHTSCTYNVINTLGHKDDAVAIKYATRISKITKNVVTCICGIHYDQFNNIKLEEVYKFVEEDIKRIEDKLSNKFK